MRQGASEDQQIRGTGRLPLPVLDREPERGHPDPAVFHVAGEPEWYLWCPCEHCGGHRLGLDLASRANQALAQIRGESFLALRRSRFCLRCQALEWRSSASVPPPAAPSIWWDTETEEWIAWLPMGGAELGVSVPLGVTTYAALAEARAAARTLLESPPLPLRVVPTRAEVDVDIPALFSDGSTGSWRLWFPCDDCGGLELELVGGRRTAVEEAHRSAVRSLERIGEHGCPLCTSQRHKDNDDVLDEPHLWFDPELPGWIVSQDLPGSDEPILIPLGIEHFDASAIELHRAVADFLFQGDQLDDGHCS